VSDLGSVATLPDRHRRESVSITTTTMVLASSPVSPPLDDFFGRVKHDIDARPLFVVYNGRALRVNEPVKDVDSDLGV
jgi:hypothetical protein